MVKKPVAKKKKKKLEENSGIVHIHCSSNNTIVSISDLSGKVICSSSAGMVGYKGTKKSTPYAAGQATADACKKAIENGIKDVTIKVNGIGQGRDTAIRQVSASGMNVNEIVDATPIPHNGCKPPKKPR